MGRDSDPEASLFEGEMQHGGVTSIVELETAAEAGRCRGLLRLMMRRYGTPIVGDRYGRAVHRSVKKRNLQIECVRIHVVDNETVRSHGLVLDVRLPRD